VDLQFPALVLPITTNHTPIGALIVIRGAFLFTSKDIARLEAFAGLAAVSLRRIITMEQLEQQRVELQKALQTREELLRVLAHDLRNPINTIAMAASALQKHHYSETPFKNLYEMIDRSTKRMNRLIQDVLDEALIERAGALPMNPQPHPARSLVEEVCEIASVQTRANIECHIGGDAVVYADRDRLLQVLTNLIDNAIKFTPKGGRIIVKSQIMEDHVRFSVSDTGPGIPEAYRDKIFAPYFQVPGNTHRGSGLGLAIAKRIVEQHGGTIWFEGTEGQGTTFIFTIPAKAIAA
jgi:signal transduction histidine kinase